MRTFVYRSRTIQAKHPSTQWWGRATLTKRSSISADPPLQSKPVSTKQSDALAGLFVHRWPSIPPCMHSDRIRFAIRATPLEMGPRNDARGILVTHYLSGNRPISKVIPFLAAIRGSRFLACTMRFDFLPTSWALITTLDPLSIYIRSKISSSSVHTPHHLWASWADPRIVGIHSNSRMNSEKSGEVIVEKVRDNGSRR